MDTIVKMLRRPAPRPTRPVLLALGNRWECDPAGELRRVCTLRLPSGTVVERAVSEKYLEPLYPQLRTLGLAS